MKTGDNQKNIPSGNDTWEPTPEWMLNPIPPTPETSPLVANKENPPREELSKSDLEEPKEEATQKPDQLVSGAPNKEEVEVETIVTEKPTTPLVEAQIEKQVKADVVSTKLGRLDGRPQVEIDYIIKPAKKHKHIKSLLWLMLFCLMVLGFVTFYFMQEDKWGQQSVRDRAKMKLLESETNDMEDAEEPSGDDGGVYSDLEQEEIFPDEPDAY